MKTNLEGTIYDDVHLVPVIEGAVLFGNFMNTLMYSGFLAS